MIGKGQACPVLVKIRTLEALEWDWLSSPSPVRYPFRGYLNGDCSIHCGKMFSAFNVY